jgi:pimeloyl-ACP methyl ester carboxylesterase
MRLRQFFIMKSVLNGGVADPQRIPPELLEEMYLVGNRKGHYRAFLNLLRNAETWETATMAYSNIRIPVLLLWGDRDWSRPDEREHNRQIVPGAKMATVEDGGHFLPLDRPDAVIEHLLAIQAPLDWKPSCGLASPERPHEI